MADLRQAALEELRALERSLETDPRYKKIKAIKSLLALYDRQGFASETASVATAADPAVNAWATAATQITSAPPHTEHTRNAIPVTGGRRASPERERALLAAVDYISGRASPTKTAEILSHLGELGITVGGTVPLSNLSAMLHHSPLFQTHGRLGWTLAADTARESHSNRPGSGNEREQSLATEPVASDEEEDFWKI